MIDSLDYTASRSCFIQYRSNKLRKNSPIREWNAINITFSGNRASAGQGHAIFATSLYPCQVINNGTANRPVYVVTNINDVFSVRNIQFVDNSKSQVATEGGLLHHNGNLPLE